MEERGSMVKSLPMNGGDGTYSYSRNSLYQKSVHDFVKERIKEAILEKLCSISNPFRIADFGCGTGPNTFYAMQTIVDAVQHKCSYLNMEFQVFFNDRFVNDFNTLFTSIPTTRQYYASAAPGSFHGRLFPSASINMAYSNCGLHWLSQVPESVSDSKSAAWNVGRIYYWGSPQAVVDAYAEQFEKDMQAFLSARAEEIVPGGIVVTIFPGNSDEFCHMQLPNVIFPFFSSMLVEMAYEGIIEEAKIDAFNMPLYTPTVGEMKNIVEKNECFNIETVEAIYPKIEINGSITPQSIIKSMRAWFQGLFTEHFGSVAMEKMFNRAVDKSDQISDILLSAFFISPFLWVVLTRK